MLNITLYSLILKVDLLSIKSFGSVSVVISISYKFKKLAYFLILSIISIVWLNLYFSISRYNSDNIIIFSNTPVLYSNLFDSTFNCSGRVGCFVWFFKFNLDLFDGFDFVVSLFGLFIDIYCSILTQKMDYIIYYYFYYIFYGC